jgi:hypothetical protein
LDCFPILKSKDFEHFIHKHEKIRPFRVTDLVGHENEIELFKIGTGLSYSQLIQLIEENVNTFNEYTKNDVLELHKKIEYLESLLQERNTPETSSYIPNTQFEELKTLIRQQEISFENKMTTLLHSKKEPLPIKTHTGFGNELVTLGPRLQMITVDTMTVFKVYESVAECIKEHNFKYKRPSIDRAIKERTTYMGYIWNYVPRDEDPYSIPNFTINNPQKIQNPGYIAKLNHEKTQILSVYLDRKTAAQENGYPSNSSIDFPVKTGKISNGHYYLLYNQCSQDLRDTFEQQLGKQPKLYKNGVGQFDSNKELAQEFTCKYDIIKQLQMSDKTLAKCLDKDITYNGFYYRRLGPKVVENVPISLLELVI